MGAYSTWVFDSGILQANQYPGKLQLIAQDRHDDARNILLALLPNKKPDEDFVNREMAEIQHAIDEEREAAHGSSYKALLKNGPQKFFYRTMLGIGGQFMQQLSYVNDLHLSISLCPPQGSQATWHEAMSAPDTLPRRSCGGPSFRKIYTLANFVTQRNQLDHILCPCNL